MANTYEYTIKGVTLTMSDMSRVDCFYEAACTAEWLMYNYKIEDKDKALNLGYAVRRLMNKYNYDEDMAIEEVLKELEENPDEI